jgi:Mg2+ and Co2+ transporter CorA
VQNYNSRLQNKINRIVKFLAGITLVQSIPMIISSELGMNLPGEPHWNFWIVAATITLAMVPAFLIARHFDWI